MASFDYTYSPVYGVEPYIENGGAGGAKVTENNLIISAWQNPDNIISVQPFTGADLVRPIYANDNPLVAQTERDAAALAFSSRHSARFHYVPIPVQPEVPAVTLALVLNPPPEYKQEMMGAVSFNGGNPATLSNWTIRRSLQGNYAWYDNIWSSEEGRNSTVLGASNYLVYAGLRSTYLKLGEFENIPLAFLKTNGADGSVPVAFDRTTAEGAQEMVNAVNLGNFYVAFVMTVAPILEQIQGFYFDIKWPHSSARG